jgi:hypothetical protein
MMRVFRAHLYCCEWREDRLAKNQLKTAYNSLFEIICINVQICDVTEIAC